jgi:hypothetical protein
MPRNQLAGRYQDQKVETPKKIGILVLKIFAKKRTNRSSGDFS